MMEEAVFLITVISLTGFCCALCWYHSVFLLSQIPSEAGLCNSIW